MKLLAVIGLIFIATHSLAEQQQPLMDGNYILSYTFWDREFQFVKNETDEFYHKSYAEYPFVLGEIFGQKWKIKSSKLNSIYQLPDLESFGTYSSYQGNHFLYKIRTNQYYLGHKNNSPQFGVRFLPYDDEKQNYDDIDRYILTRHGLDADDVFVSPTYYFHQEYYKGDVLALEKSSRFDDGFTHMGAYVGKGKTKNAPFDYADGKLETKGYPANLVRVIYKGAQSQKEFQKNLYITLRLMNELNGGVHFSRLDYQQDYYEANNLKSILDFYRAWLDPQWIRSAKDKRPFYEIILEDVKYDIYCSEHIAMVLNLAINLVQTEVGYIRVFGSNNEQLLRGEALQKDGLLKGGEYFWKLAQERWLNEIKDQDFLEVQDREIQEVWSLHNPLSPVIVTQITEVGRYLAWPPQTLTDLVVNLMNLYARFDLVGYKTSMDVMQRLKLLFLMRVNFLDKNKTFIKNTIVGVPQHKLDELAKPFENLIYRYWLKAKEVGLKAAYQGFQQEVAEQIFIYRDPDFLRLREDSFFYYATPHVIHRIVQGLHPYSKYLEFEILGTVLPKSDLELDIN